MNHPALNRILNQIKEHKGELLKPENLMGASSKEEFVEDGDPLKDIRDFFTEEELDEREKILAAQEKREKQEEEAQEKGQEEPVEEDFNPDSLVPQTLPPDVKEFLESPKEEFEFHSCYDLRDFFIANRESFDEWALPAIDSVLQAVSSITAGCKCKLKERTKMVEQYYTHFITQNQHTSLIKKMKEILKTKKIKFYSEEKLFLEL
jgi:hypothetical protein